MWTLGKPFTDFRTSAQHPWFSTATRFDLYVELAHTLDEMLDSDDWMKFCRRFKEHFRILLLIHTTAFRSTYFFSMTSEMTLILGWLSNLFIRSALHLKYECFELFAELIQRASVMGASIVIKYSISVYITILFYYSALKGLASHWLCIGVDLL